MQNFFSTGFDGVPAPTTTGAPGGETGTSLQFGNVLAGDAAGNLSTGAPGGEGHGTRIDPGTVVAVTDPGAHPYYGSAAPQIHGSTGTSALGGTEAAGTGTPNPTSTGAGQGSVTDGSERIQ